ncbi:hypothetical protein GGF46_004399 [Coemansia sp. RSA 552]|nr:hypothetical protein GGF46_004399 [Coemansia sp. RSA 552]
MGSTDPSSRFISESTIEEARKERGEAWKRAYEAGSTSEAPPPPPPDADYDPRTLYERLQEQRAIKGDALAESRRFANQIRKLDTDELEFLDEVDERERKKQLEQQQKERSALAEFNEKVAEQREQLRQSQKRRQPPRTPAKPAKNRILDQIGVTVVRRTHASSTQPGPEHKRPDLGCAQPGSDEHKGPDPVCAQPVSERKRSDPDCALDQERSPEQESDSEEGDRKRQKPSDDPQDCAPATKENSLSALAAYASDSSDDERP